MSKVKHVPRQFLVPAFLMVLGSLALVAANQLFASPGIPQATLAGVPPPGALPPPLPPASFAAALMARALMFAGYIIALVRLRRTSTTPALRTLLSCALLFCLPFFFMPFLFQTDVYSYVIYGRIAAIHDGNPFVDLPSRYPGDPYQTYVSPAWRYQPSVYGPAWVALSHLLTLLVEGLGGGAWLYELVYRLALIALHLGGALLVWRILGRLRPQLQGYGTLLFAWNPLLLIESGAYIHNDALMLFLLLLALWLHLSRRYSLAMLALALAILTKWIPALLVPFYLVLLLRELDGWRQRLRMVARGLAVGAAAALLTYAPYWSGPETLSVFSKTPSLSRGMNSLGDLIVKELLARDPPMVEEHQVRGAGAGQLPRRGGAQVDDDIVMLLETERTIRVEAEARPARLYQAAIRIGLALVGLAGLWWIRRVRDMQSLIQSWTWILFVYLCFGAIWFLPWYVTWFVGLAALLPYQRAESTALVFAASALLGDVLPAGWDVTSYRALVIFLPPLLWVVGSSAKAYLLARQRSRHA
jgi:hypothetical protein